MTSRGERPSVHPAFPIRMASNLDCFPLGLCNRAAGRGSRVSEAPPHRTHSTLSATVPANGVLQRLARPHPAGAQARNSGCRLAPFPLRHALDSCCRQARPTRPQLQQLPSAARRHGAPNGRPLLPAHARATIFPSYRMNLCYRPPALRDAAALPRLKPICWSGLSGARAMCAR
jgi:hypothetical protein